MANLHNDLVTEVAEETRDALLRAVGVLEGITEAFFILQQREREQEQRDDVVMTANILAQSYALEKNEYSYIETRLLEFLQKEEVFLSSDDLDDMVCSAQLFAKEKAEHDKKNAKQIDVLTTVQELMLTAADRFESGDSFHEVVAWFEFRLLEYGINYYYDEVEKIVHEAYELSQ